jgi:hypothetical protein
MNQLHTAFSLLSVVLLAIMNCTTDPVSTAGGTETGDAMVTGMIVDANGNPVKGATVRMVPVGFDARQLAKRLAKTRSLTAEQMRAALLAEVDSAVTDSNGVFSFDTVDTGTYNVLADSGTNLAYQDSVAVEPDTQTTVPTDTLKAPGSVRGVVRLQPGDDSRKVFVIALGTFAVTAPSDSIGNFAMADMAEGTYSTRILSTLDDYGVLDTTFSVAAGIENVLADTIDLPYTGIPVPQGLTINYDTLTQIVTLTWNRPTTGRTVAGYNIYRQYMGSTDSSLAKIRSNVTDTLFRDSAGIEDQTYEYRIAAVDTSITEGTKSAAVQIRMLSAFQLIDTIGGGFGSQNGQFSYLTGIACLSNGDIVGLDYNRGLAQVFDSTGGFLFTFGQQGTLNGQFENPIDIAADDSSNIYILDQSSNGRIQKFSPLGIFENLWAAGQNCSGICYSNQMIYAATITPRGFESINIINDSISQVSIPSVYPTGIGFFENSSSLFIADYLGSNIIQSDTNGQILNTFSSKGNALGQLNSPRLLKISPQGNIYVANENGSRIQVFEPTGEFLSVFAAGKISDPKGIAFDGANHVYVADGALNSILKFNIGL